MITTVNHQLSSDSIYVYRQYSKHYWNFPGKNTGLGFHFLLQGISPTQGLNPWLVRLLNWLSFSRSVVSDSLRPHELQYPRLSCPSPPPGVCSNSCQLSQWCHPTISSSVVPSPPAFNLSQHQSLFQTVGSSPRYLNTMKSETVFYTVFIVFTTVKGKLRAGGDDRGWDGWMASPTQRTWVWVNSGSWWWTGRPGVLQFMGSQRVGHDWATELDWTTVFCWIKMSKQVKVKVQVLYMYYYCGSHWKSLHYYGFWICFVLLYIFF